VWQKVLEMKKYYNYHAVIGLGFGDEGKGLTVNALCQNLSRPLVIRYSGGQQAGHTVTLPGGKSHVFSNFGSGTLHGVPTYWSQYCTFDPVGVVNEYNVLNSKSVIPRIYVNKRSPITTPFEKEYNRRSAAMEHGTCGVGVGPTFAREEKFYSLTVGDLLFPSVFRMKMSILKEFYSMLNPDLEGFYQACEFIMERRHHSFHFVNWMPDNDYDNFIFEGSQGLLLDKDAGFFPHVTRSNVGTKNICNLAWGDKYHKFLITRAFQTRHGNGPMTNEGIPHNIKDNPKETNVQNIYQGQFRKSILDLDLLKYGISKDPNILPSDCSLVITCLDLVENEYRYTVDGEIVSHPNEDAFVEGIALELGVKIENVHRVRAPDALFTPYEKSDLERIMGG
jgi:adenylosuccinate synthase